MEFQTKDDFSAYLSGERLYGDDFTSNEIEKWFEDEAEGYANLGARRQDRYRYVYHELNNQHGFKFIRHMSFDAALGIGSAYGDEFKPISGNINRITILDPSDAFSDAKAILEIPCEYLKPRADGHMPFTSGQFDLITSLGVMHHIPNVSHVIGECYRCLSKGGIMLLREPIVSMGDWRRPRPGLTKRERGIPLNFLNNIIGQLKFKVIRKSLCKFPLIPKLASSLGVAAYNNSALTSADALLSKMFSWNIKYHRTKLHEKFAPASVYYVLKK